MQRVPYRINPRRSTPRHVLIKLSKIKYKEKILKAARGKQQITYKGIPVRGFGTLPNYSRGRNTPKLILRGHHHPDTKTRKRCHTHTHTNNRPISLMNIDAQQKSSKNSSKQNLTGH